MYVTGTRFSTMCGTETVSVCGIILQTRTSYGSTRSSRTMRHVVTGILVNAFGDHPTDPRRDFPVDAFDNLVGQHGRALCGPFPASSTMRQTCTGTLRTTLVPYEKRTDIHGDLFHRPLDQVVTGVCRAPCSVAKSCGRRTGWTGSLVPKPVGPVDVANAGHRIGDTGRRHPGQACPLDPGH